VFSPRPHDPEFLSRLLRDEVLPRLRVEDVYPNVRFRQRGRHWRAPCPLHDGRDLNFAVDVETLAWKCHSQCQAGGDAASFVMKTAQLDFREAVLELARRAGLDLDDRARVRTSVPERPKRSAPSNKMEAGEGALRYPPAEEVTALWDACLRVDEVPAVRSWLSEQRRIEPSKVADLDLARVVPTALEGLPRWAGYGGSEGQPWRAWPAAGLSLVVPLYDARGQMRSVLFRRPFESAKNWPPKSVSAGGSRVALAMACPFARQLLAERAWPAWWPSDAARPIVVAEGEMDFLTLATEWSDSGDLCPATLGGTAGSWSLLEQVPSGSTLLIRTHADEAGAKYASEILSTVLSRWRARDLMMDLPLYFEVRGEKVAVK
jgi:CHC2-type zinc finger protein